MKLTSLLTAIAVAAFTGSIALAADDAAPAPTAPTKEGCKMMKMEPMPAGACMCPKMKSEAPAKPDLGSLVEKLKSAKGDDTLSAFAAVLNEIVAERKAASQEKSGEAPAAPAEHEHHH